MERQRASFYRPENKRKKLEERSDVDVTINIGIVKLGENGQLKPVRGKIIPLKVKRSVKKDELLDKAVKKQQAHNDIGTGPFELLYPNFMQVKKLLEKDEEFILEKYKIEVGKAYNRLNFFLVSITDHIKSHCFQKSDSDDDDEDGGGDEIDSQFIYGDWGASSASLYIEGEAVPPVNISPLTSSEEISLQAAHPSKNSIDSSTQTGNANENMHIPLDLSTACNSTSSFSQDIIPAGESYASLFCSEYPTDDDEVNAGFSADTAFLTDNKDHSFREAVQEISSKALSQEESVRVKVRRTSVWEDAKRKLKRFNAECWSKSLSVQFVGESAVDEGGPKREFTALVHSMVQKSKMFEGGLHERCFSNNFSALKEEDYKLYGKFCAWTLLQGCPAPSFFAPPVVDYIIFGTLEKVESCADYIPQSCPYICDFLTKLSKVNNDEQLREICDHNIEILLDVGYTKPKMALEDKDDIIKSLVWKTAIGNSMLAISQFVDGISMFGFLDVIRKYPEEARSLFQSAGKKSLSAEVIDDMFEPQLSDFGSNRRCYEESILMNFTHFLEDLEAGNVTANVLCLEDDAILERVLNLKDFLQFVTGSPTIPILGFDASPSIVFNHDDPNRKLSVSTCSLELRFPVNPNLLVYDSFRQEMIDCIISSPGFGQV